MVYTNIRDFQFRGVPEKLLTSVTQKQKHAIHVCFGSLFWVVVIFMFLSEVVFASFLHNTAKF